MKPCTVTSAGSKHGLLTVIGKGEKCGHNYKYRFACDCGTQFEAHAWTTIQIGHCGCLRPTIEERLVCFLLIDEITGCWNFQGCLNNNGYGQVGLDGYRKMYAHRLAWALWRGDIPKGLCVLHKCDNSKCCNPSHLFLGTVADNNADCLSKGRHVSGFTITRPVQKPKPGELNASHKLTNKDVLYARAAFSRGISFAETGRRLGVNENTVAYAVKGKTWKHLWWSTAIEPTVSPRGSNRASISFG